MKISDVLRTKGTEVFTVRPDATVREFLDILLARRVGACVVSRDGRTIAGIVSERDVATGLAGRGAQLLDEAVWVIATTHVHTTAPETHLHEVMALMTHHRVRHLPVLVQGELAGIVSLGDIVKHRLDELESEQRHLVDYISSAR
jgi:CBS domain-containing protein